MLAAGAGIACCDVVAALVFEAVVGPVPGHHLVVGLNDGNNISWGFRRLSRRSSWCEIPRRPRPPPTTSSGDVRRILGRVIADAPRRVGHLHHMSAHASLAGSSDATFVDASAGRSKLLVESGTVHLSACWMLRAHTMMSVVVASRPDRHATSNADWPRPWRTPSRSKRTSSPGNPSGRPRPRRRARAHQPTGQLRRESAVGRPPAGSVRPAGLREPRRQDREHRRFGS